MRLAILLLALATGQFHPKSLPGIPQVTDRKVAPDRITEGWLVDLKTDSSGAQVPTTLVISRNGRELQRFHGEPGIATWDFWGQGQEAVYQTAPIHGRTTCYLVSVSSGQILETQENCSNHQTDGPGWTQPLHN